MRVQSHFKAVDLLAIQPPAAHETRQTPTLWLIEVKDYRSHRRTKEIPLDQEVAEKAICTLAGLLPAALRATNSNEQKYAQKAIRCKELRVILHLEPPARGSSLFTPKLERTTIQDSLRRKIRALDPHPKVVDRASTLSLPWTVC